MPKFTTVPKTVEADQYTGRNAQEILVWMKGSELEEDLLGSYIRVTTQRQVIHIEKDDWIVEEAPGEFIALPDDCFRNEYKPD